MPAMVLPLALALPVVAPPTAFLDHFEKLNVVPQNSSEKNDLFNQGRFGMSSSKMVNDPLRTGPEKRLLDQGRFWYR